MLPVLFHRNNWCRKLVAGARCCMVHTRLQPFVLPYRDVSGRLLRTQVLNPTMAALVALFVWNFQEEATTGRISWRMLEGKKCALLAAP